MTAYVVDTNVAKAANGRDTHADLACQLDCIEKLETICRESVIVLDEGDLIFEEYRNHLLFKGAPGTGDKFFKHLYDHKYGESRVRRVPITPCNDDLRGYQELPENELDRSDRKFLAVAVVAQAEILNATDSDWNEQEALISGLGVSVRQLCPHHASKSANHS